MINFILTRILGGIGKKLDGNRTKLSGIPLGLVAIAGGIAGLAGNMWPDQGLPVYDPVTCLGMIGAGGSMILAAFGIAGKFEKQTAAIKEQNELLRQAVPSDIEKLKASE